MSKLTTAEEIITTANQPYTICIGQCYTVKKPHPMQLASKPIKRVVRPGKAANRKAATNSLDDAVFNAIVSAVGLSRPIRIAELHGQTAALSMRTLHATIGRLLKEKRARLFTLPKKVALRDLDKTAAYTHQRKRYYAIVARG